jgi:serine/threonine protein kinase
MGCDLLCFEDATLQKKVFLMNMRNVFFDEGSVSQSHITYFTVILKISPCISRTLYFRKIEEQQLCLMKLSKASEDDLTCKEALSHNYIDKNVPIGEGAFGKVSLFQCKRSQEEVAIKQLRKNVRDISELFDQIEEYYTVKTFDNPYVLKVRELYEDENSFFIVMKRVRGSNLAEFLFSGLRDEKRTKAVIYKIFKGIEYIHTRGVAHRDLKLENIMVVTDLTSKGPEYNPVIIDFGLSKLFMHG